MQNGRVLSRQFVEIVRMLLGGLPDMSSGDAQWLIALPGVEKRVGELIDSLLPEVGPGYGASCDGTKSWDDLLSEGHIIFEGSLGGIDITPHPKEDIIVQLLRRDNSSPVPLALAQYMIRSRGSRRACNPEEMLSWIVKNWHDYLEPLQPIVFPDPKATEIREQSDLYLSLILEPDRGGKPLLNVDINRKEWSPGTWFAVVIR